MPRQVCSAGFGAMRNPVATSTSPLCQTGIRLLVLLFVFFTGISAAQMPPGIGQGTANEMGAENGETREADPRLSSPGKTFETFFRSFGDPGTGREPTIGTNGIATMDFSGTLSLMSEAQRIDAAKTLKNVLDRVRYVETEEVDKEAAGSDNYVFERFPGIGIIEIEKNERGEWRFSEETIESLDRMWSYVEDRSVVEGVETTVSLTPAQWVRSKVPENLKQTGFLLETWQWLGLLVLVALGVAADRLFVFILTLISHLIEKRLGIDVSKENRRSALKPLGLLAMAGTWALCLGLLMLPTGVSVVLLVAVKFLAALSFVLATYKGVDAIERIFVEKASRTDSKMDDLIVPFVGRVAKIFVVAFGIVFVASNVGVNISGLLAGLGLGGLAFALAAKDTVSNIFGSLTILIDRPFSVGDWVVLENGVDGTVETVGLRSTRIRTFYNSLITVPNSTLITSFVDNYGERRYRRWKTTLGLTYDTPPQKIEAFCEGIREIVRLHPYTRKDYYHIYANEFGPASLDILVYVFFEAPDWGTELRERHRLFLDVLRLAKELGVEFAFPTQTLHIVRDLPEHGDRPSSTGDALEKGRLSARHLVGREFGGKVEKPAPVRINLPADVDLDEYMRERTGGGAE